jgi:hypothetical protein
MFFFLLFNQTSYSNEEVNCTDPTNSISLPWLKLANSPCECHVEWKRKKKIQRVGVVTIFTGVIYNLQGQASVLEQVHASLLFQRENYKL